MKKIRFGVIGLGLMGRQHAQSLLTGKVRGATLAGVADADPAKLRDWPPDVAAHAEVAALLRDETIPAVVIATPHFAHTEVGIAALRAGKHVMVEKPVSVHKADVERLIQAPRRKDQVFAAMLNQRSHPAFIKLRAMIRKGELGEIRRINWIVTHWFRPEAYYRSGSWRATWAGEGGGVLLNQSPHQLDLWTWLFGPPAKVRAHCRFGQWHRIEVEDDVTAYLEYANGATGVFITTTGEAPGTNRLEVAGEKGRVVYENDALVFTRNREPMSRFSRTTRELFGRPGLLAEKRFTFNGQGGQHVALLQNFADAIGRGRPLIAPAVEGIHSVELANAMLLSTWMDRTISLPMDGALYERWLGRKIAASRHSKKQSS
jgi:predicted dehydrogenase